jgi:hypothetical protein
MSLGIIIVAVIGLLFVSGISTLYLKKRKKKRNYPNVVQDKWLAVQKLCASKDTWNLAVTDADELLREVLKHKGFKGKSIGKGLVAAQHKLTDNDSVWYAHNLAKRLMAKPKSRLKEAEVKKALIGFRQALRDLGVLNGK